MTATTTGASLVVVHPRILMSQITSAYNFYTVASLPTVQVENLGRAWWHMQDDVFWRNQRGDLADSYGNPPANSKQLAVFRDNVIEDAREKILGPQSKGLLREELIHRHWCIRG